MTEEKITNEEILNEEELEGVAGGTTRELIEDANRLRALGALPQGRSVSKKDINDAFVSLGIGIGCKTLEDDERNVYYINHKKATHEQVWNYIYEQKGGRRY